MKIHGDKPQTWRSVIFSFQQPWASCLEKCGFFTWCTSLCLAIKQDQDGQYSGAELQMGRKVSTCQIFTIFYNLSILIYLSITWPSCNVSGRIDFIFCLFVGRWHPHLSDSRNFGTAVNTLVAKWRFKATSPKLGDRLFSAFSSPGRVV